jgi:hypothetical protein
MEFFSFRQPTFAALWSRWWIPFLGALFVQVNPAAPQVAGRLFAVCPDVAKLLAVMTQRKTILSSMCLHPDCDVSKALQSENFLGFCRSRQGY